MATPITAQRVIDHYSAVAREEFSRNARHISKAAESFGYSPEDLANIPEGANLGLSCGNPLAIAGLKDGEVVIDLGSGAGFDVFQAARKIGPSGLAIGIDGSIDMLERARLNAMKASITNVNFVQSPITFIPLQSNSADCIISNCVINLLSRENKKVCFGEIYRLLKYGGRLAVSDTLAKKPFPAELQKNMGLYVGCISGASLVSEYETWLKETGFEGMFSSGPLKSSKFSTDIRGADIMIVDKKIDLNIYKERDGENQAALCCVPSLKVGAKTEGKSCCSSSSTCCLSEPMPDPSKAVADIDFNEWVSKYS